VHLKQIEDVRSELVLALNLRRGVDDADGVLVLGLRARELGLLWQELLARGELGTRPAVELDTDVLSADARRKDSPELARAQVAVELARKEEVKLLLDDNDLLAELVRHVNSVEDALATRFLFLGDVALDVPDERSVIANQLAVTLEAARLYVLELLN